MTLSGNSGFRLEKSGKNHGIFFEDFIGNPDDTDIDRQSYVL